MLIILGQQEQLRDTAIHDLVVVGSATQTQELRIHVDIVSSSGGKDVDFVETENDIASDLTELGLLLHHVVECLSGADLLAFLLVLGLLRARIGPLLTLDLGTRNVKADFNHLIRGTAGRLLVLRSELK